ncbi:UDP-2,3-diacylglucosamine pyrophosphatase LpxH [Anseongella ginsenosidimutans]|uniref:UDP-2,3-diacylglucosamine pyrophosphatase LpxH n=1 Tax=Anseongella ginsenosidimutans TaxID=496056 RepID=A0A4R3KP12_9SPHI|nr:UDP-2,3-diacylglucosamine diphosphatase [Anseongella ginsenosidimutans]QEC52086.1 UDP-2,3-diacylglucosamine diphosphatase [Anseongella ginsenosidimutans]TCS85603.1 UDP-2,3-diacylglucosamine pyrophosphatase LpxH [Anseongella ginsenosidimutans]
MTERNVEMVVISDVHLGTYGCHAVELLQYLRSIRPKVLVLNGDIIDIWQFSKRYWPDAHMQVIRKIMKFITEDVQVFYLTGNHDEMLRKFADLKLDSFQLKNKLVLNIGQEKVWLFHGDVFDVTMQHSKWLAKLGAFGYDSLILLNSFVNWLLKMAGRPKMSFSRKIKSSVKSAVKFMSDFEATAASIAIENGYDYVICGHIHHPEIRKVKTESGSITYLNSGDWVESLSALEYDEGKWNLYYYKPEHFASEKMAAVIHA